MSRYVMLGTCAIPSQTLSDADPAPPLRFHFGWDIVSTLRVLERFLDYLAAGWCTGRHLASVTCSRHQLRSSAGNTALKSPKVRLQASREGLGRLCLCVWPPCNLVWCECVWDVFAPGHKFSTSRQLWWCLWVRTCSPRLLVETPNTTRPADLLLTHRKCALSTLLSRNRSKKGKQ